MTLEGTIDFGDDQVSVTVDVELAGDAFSGTVTSSGSWGDETQRIAATRDPEPHDHDHLEDEGYTCH